MLGEGLIFRFLILIVVFLKRYKKWHMVLEVFTRSTLSVALSTVGE